MIPICVGLTLLLLFVRFPDPVVGMARATTDIRRRRWHAARTHLCGPSCPCTSSGFISTPHLSAGDAYRLGFEAFAFGSFSPNITRHRTFPSFLDTLSSERGLFNQGIRKQVLYLLLGSCLRTVSRSAIYLRIGPTCLAITPMVCLYTPGAYVLSLNAYLPLGIISM
jgi:hypothetical protein